MKAFAAVYAAFRCSDIERSRLLRDIILAYNSKQRGNLRWQNS